MRTINIIQTLKGTILILFLSDNQVCYYQEIPADAVVVPSVVLKWLSTVDDVITNKGIK